MRRRSPRRFEKGLKTAKAEGLLPTEWKCSVRSHNFAGGCSIDVEVSGPRDAIIVEENPNLCPMVGPTRESICQPHWHFSHRCPGARRLTDLAESAMMTLERIHQAYNHDGSDTMTDYFDVRYYGQVKFSTHTLYGSWAI